MYAVGGQVFWSCFLLAGCISYSQAKQKRKPEYVEDLSFMELLGLHGLENMTYLMLLNVVFLYLARTTDMDAGIEHITVAPWMWFAASAIGFIGVIAAEKETHHL